MSLSGAYWEFFLGWRYGSERGRKSRPGLKWVVMSRIIWRPGGNRHLATRASPPPVMIDTKERSMHLKCWNFDELLLKYDSKTIQQTNLLAYSLGNRDLQKNQWSQPRIYEGYLQLNIYNLRIGFFDRKKPNNVGKATIYYRCSWYIGMKRYSFWDRNGKQQRKLYIWKFNFISENLILYLKLYI